MSENEVDPTNNSELHIGEPLAAPVVAPLVEDSGLPWGPIVGGLAVAGALLGGVWFATSGDSEVDLAAPEPATEVAEEEGSVEEDPIDEETSDESNAVADDQDREIESFEEEAMVDDAEFAMDSVGYGGYYGANSSAAVWDGEQFVRLQSDSSGWTAFTSANGIDWVETPAAGLPEDGYLYNLVEQDGVIAGILEQYSEDSAKHFLVSSTNATDWTSVELPGSDQSSESWYGGLAIVDGGAVAVRTTYDYGNDPYQILMDSGILSGGLEEEFCGFDYSEEGGPIDLLTCNYEEYEENYPSDEEMDALAAKYDAAETNEERDAIEEELDALWGGGNQEVFMTISPGDPLYDQVSEGLFGDYDHESNEEVEVITGPLAGPFEASSPFDQGGYMTGLVQTDSAVFAGFETYNEDRGTSAVAILTSTDGVNWSPVASPPASNGGGLQAFGNALFFMSYDNDGASTSYISTNSATSWTVSPLESSLFETYTEFGAGDAGMIALTQGTLEPYEYNEPDFPEGNPVLNKDGYTLELGWNDGSLTLTGPNGLLIEVNEEEAYSQGSDSIRLNPISGHMTFLDPETGDDLVTFTEEDWEEIYGAYEDDYGYDEEWVEPARGYELHFSTNGTTWNELDASVFGEIVANSHVGLVGVGDDEAVFFIETYNESEPDEELFAFEIEGREPTGAEIEALEYWEQNQSTTEYVRVPLG